MNSEFEIHFPVLLDPILEFASNLENLQFPVIVDGTLGAGGHTLALFRKFPGSRVYSFDRDPEMIQIAKNRIESENIRCLEMDKPGRTDSPGVAVINRPFSEAARLLKDEGIFPDFIMLDLGVSMHHFRSAKRGFSYTDEILDMRLSPDLPLRASDVLEKLSEEELASVFRNYGEERYSGRIARAIKENLPMKSARDLADTVMKSTGFSKKDGDSGKKIHPATRIFQALRIYVNRELEELSQALQDFPGILNTGGRFAVISFHSLEDRLVKNTFRGIGQKISKPKSARREKYRTSQEIPEFIILTPTPVLPGEAEIKRNPPSRSAKLRVIERIVRK